MTTRNHNDTNVFNVCTWWCFLLHRALRLACRQRWPHLGSAGQFPPSAAQSHPPRQSRRFLTCRHGNHPNIPITKKSPGVRSVSRGFWGISFVVIPIVSDKRPQHTVTSMLMMSPSWRGRLKETERTKSKFRVHYLKLGDILSKYVLIAHLPVRYAVTDHIVHRGTHWFREAPVSKWGRVRVVLDGLLVHDEVYFICCHTDLETTGL